MRKPILLSSLLLVVAILLVACLAPAPATEAPATEAPALATEEAITETTVEEVATELPVDEVATELPVAEIPTEPSTSATPLDARTAVDTALTALPGSAIIEIERGNWREYTTWEIVVRNSNGGGTELYIDMATGEVVKQEATEIPPYARSSAPAITADVAMTTAVSTTLGTIEEVDLGQENGRIVWEVLVATINGRVEYYIDATTGAIIEQESP